VIQLNRVRLIHWNSAEAKEKAAILHAAGFEVDCRLFTPQNLRELRNVLPSAVVIDLSRLPSQGRDVGLAIRHYKTTHNLPLVFVDGVPEKVARIKTQIPDAIYTTWNQILDSLKQAIAHPPKVTVSPKSLLEGYSGTPLAKKLGIKANSVVTLVDAPQDFERSLGELPKNVTLLKKMSNRPNLIIWFTRSRKDLEKGIKRMMVLADNGGIWIVWPKKTSQLVSDLSQATVRQIGIAAGLVDYKVCSIDATWSGLLFTRRKPK